MILRNLPSVDHLLQNSGDYCEKYSRNLTIKAIRKVLDEIRIEIIQGHEFPNQERILSRIELYLESWAVSSLKPVINATGVLLHTNLGRAPLALSAIQAMEKIAGGYSNIEYDVESGKRGSRMVHLESILKNITGAESGLVVNNCASAVLLVLTALANRRPVIIPRSQLIEIGGGFRVPDVMKQSGAKLIEIGTTNKLRLSDFEVALAEISTSSQAFVLRAHRSNFKLIGFTEEPDVKNIIDVTHDHNAFFFDDLGSGALLDTAIYGMSHEPTVQESIAAGADIVMFSGDKLVGGPQAGIIVGRAELIAKIAKHPLTRAVRADKFCIAGLTETLLHYLKNEAISKIPLWQMISMPIDQIKLRASYWQQQIGTGEVLADESTVGGGSLPGEKIPTWVLALKIRSPEKFLRKLRNSHTPVIARMQNDQILFDPRTVRVEEDDLFLNCVKMIM